MNIQQFWDAWIPAWAISRQIPPAEKLPFGYIFEEVNDGRREKELLLFSKDDLPKAEPLMSNKDYLCVSGIDETFIVPQGWKDAMLAAMMMQPELKTASVELPKGFSVASESSEQRFAVRLLNANNELVSQGQIGYYGDYAVFDYIATNENYRRQGLATIVMNLLTQDALNRNIQQGLLCASEQGQLLYQTLGWQTLGFYKRLTRENYTRETIGGIFQ